MMLRKLTPQQESAILELVKMSDWLGQGLDTELVIRPHEHLRGECYIHAVGKENYIGVPCHLQTLELLEDGVFLHQSIKPGNFCLRQEALGYKN